MGSDTKSSTPHSTDSEGEVFTDGDFEDSEDDITIADPKKTIVPVNETINVVVRKSQTDFNGTYRNSECDERNNNNIDINKMVDGHSNGQAEGNNAEDGATELRQNSHEDFNPSIVGIIGNQHNQVSVCDHDAISCPIPSRTLTLTHS